MADEIVSGKVWHWDDASGFGVIKTAGRWVRVHRSAVHVTSRPTLREGQEVHLQVIPSLKGPMASDVRPVPGTEHRRQDRFVEGTVKWFNSTKGYGFITVPDQGDVFAHFSCIETDGFRDLKEDQHVWLTVEKREKGLAAKRITLAEPESASPPPAEPVVTGYALTLVDGHLQIASLLSDGAYAVVEGSERVNAFLHFAISGQAGRILEALEELEWRISHPDTREEDLQAFFEKHPDFLLGTDYRRLHPQLVLRRDDAGPLVPDFMLEPITSPSLCDLLDLKLPQAQVLVGNSGRRRFAQSVMQAVAQLREYAQFFDDPCHREDALRRYGVSAYRPTAAVIIGRDPSDVPLEEFQDVRRDIPWLRVMTYDDIVRRGKALVQHITE
jgi:cold shock CspA family protein